MILTPAPDLDRLLPSAPGEALALHRGAGPDGVAPDDTADYAELRRLVASAGLLEPQPAYYVGKFAGLGLLLGIGLLVLVRAPSLPGWVQVLNVVYCAVLFGQIGLLGHDVA